MTLCASNADLKSLQTERKPGIDHKASREGPSVRTALGGPRSALRRDLDTCGRRWTNALTFESAHYCCNLDGLDGLDGTPCFQQKGFYRNRAAARRKACERRITRRQRSTVGLSWSRGIGITAKNPKWRLMRAICVHDQPAQLKTRIGSRH